MYVVGTAGHVDHGKSTLIQALTGINPDRLPQERERGMTIDLGFAWLTLPSGQEVSIIDVPGHERFVRNMLAGVGGIDMALLVVAADEGVMPQTREHLAILDLLHVRRGLVALTKADLVDEDLLELAEMETVEALQDTVLEDAAIITLSARTGQGLDTLLQKMDEILAATSPRPDLGRPRLAVDRSFTVSGFGTVVTGTLIDGTLRVGQDVELVPSQRRGRIRGLQSHRQKLTEADPGRRLAINISGVSYDKAERGETVTTSGWLQPTTMLDAKVKLLADAPRPMKHNARVSFHSHVSETGARIRLLDARQLLPGREAWAQIHLTDPVPLVKGDFFVVRSTETTIGGGKVVDPFPRRHRPFTASVLKSLQAMEEGTLEELILGAVDQWGPCDLTALSQRSNLTLDDVRPVIEDLAKQGGVTLLGGAKAGPGSQVYSRHGWQRLKRQCAATLKEYHGPPSPSTGHPQGGIQEPPGRIRGRFPPPLGPPGGRKVSGRRRSRRSLPRLSDYPYPGSGESGPDLRRPTGRQPLLTSHRRRRQSRTSRPTHQPQAGGESRRLRGVQRRRLPPHGPSRNPTHRRTRQHHRCGGPHPAGLQPQIRAAPTGIPRPAARHPPHRRQACVEVTNLQASRVRELR